MKKIVLVGGHANPAIALYERLQKLSVEIYFFGRKTSTEGDSSFSLEYQFLHNEKRLTFITLDPGRLHKRFSKTTVKSASKIPVGFFQAFKKLQKIKPDLIVVFGGYLTPPVALAGWVLRIPVVLHEQTSVPGLSSKFASQFAKQIFISFKSSQKYFPESKTFFTGNLLRHEITTPPQSLQSPLANFLNSKKNFVYVTGGGQGSHLINQFVIDNLSQLQKLDLSLIIQTGSTNSAADFEKLKSLKTPNMFVATHFSTSEVSLIMSKKPLVLGRSGANTVTEIVYFKLKSILVPLEISRGGEQLINAKTLEKFKVANILFTHTLTFANFKSALDNLENVDFSQKIYQEVTKELKIDLDFEILTKLQKTFDLN